MLPSATFRRRLLRYLAALLSVVAGIAAASLLQRLPLANLSLVFLTVVIVVAAHWGSGPAIFASLLSFLAFNFLFTPPYHTFRVANEEDVATLLFFLVMAVIIGNLAARMRAVMEAKRIALNRISELYEFGRQMTAALGTDDVIQHLCRRLSALLARPVFVLLPDDSGTLQIRASSDSHDASPLWLSAMRRAWAEQGPSCGVEMVRLNSGGTVCGIVAIEGEALAEEQNTLAAALCDQAATAMERTRLAADLASARLNAETEQLRSALLSSVSHDLRTPLASIIGSASSVIEYGDAFRVEDRRELLQTVLDEAQRLDRYIQNLLDMTRVGRGAIDLKRDWHDLHDVVAAAAARLASALDGFQLKIEIAEPVALLNVHGVFLEQALVNLLDNAVRYSPSGGTIAVKAGLVDGFVRIDVVDEGPGIVEVDRDRVFDMFYRAGQGDHSVPGSGLGLAICRGLIGAHGGTIEALAGPDGVGTCIRITLPGVAAAHEVT